jgi:hypothetical protein
MDTVKQQSAADRDLVVRDSGGRDAVRIYLQYLPTLSARSRGARTKALRNRFEKVARKHAGTGVELYPESLSESGQVIEALVPAERYEEAIHELEGDDIRVDLVQEFQATL